MVSMVIFSFGRMFRNLRVSSVLMAATVITSFGPMLRSFLVSSVFTSLRSGYSPRGRWYFCRSRTAWNPPALEKAGPGAVSPNDRASSRDFLRVPQVILAGNSLTFRNLSAACRPSGVNATDGTSFFRLVGSRVTSPWAVSLTIARSTTAVKALPDQRCPSKGPRSFSIFSGLSPFSPTGRSRVRTNRSSGERFGSSVIDGSSSFSGQHSQTTCAARLGAKDCLSERDGDGRCHYPRLLSPCP